MVSHATQSDNRQCNAGLTAFAVNSKPSVGKPGVVERGVAKPRVCLAHHWATGMRGGEKVLGHMAELFDVEDIYTLVHQAERLDDTLRRRRFHTTLLDRHNVSRSLYRHALPLHPSLIRRLRVRPDCDLLISSDAALIKGVATAASTRHLCYCHSPPRYLWEMPERYGSKWSPTRISLALFGPSLRAFDRRSADGVDHFVANSQFVRDRIRRYYDRDADVVHPPVDIDRFAAVAERTSNYVVVSELTAYKRIDLAVGAATRMDLPLTIIGDGPEAKRLRAMAGPTVRFLGRAADEVVKHELESAEGFLFPGIEDFGMAPVEAMSAGCGVVAFGRGGSRETVVQETTGVFFDNATVDSLVEAIRRHQTLIKRGVIHPAACRRQAEKFSTATFRSRMSDIVERMGVASDAVDRPTTDYERSQDRTAA